MWYYLLKSNTNGYVTLALGRRKKLWYDQCSCFSWMSWLIKPAGVKIMLETIDKANVVVWLCTPALHLLIYMFVLGGCCCLVVSRVLVFCNPTRLLCPWNFLGKNTGVGCHFPLQGIFLTQGSNPCLLHWQADSLPLSYLGNLDLEKGLLKR